MPAFVTGVTLPVTASAEDSAKTLVTGDFNQDGKLDVLAITFEKQQVLVYKGNGDGTFQSPVAVSYLPGQTPDAAATADLNGDGKLDLVISDESLPTVYVSLGNGDGTFQTAVPYPAAAGPSKIVIADVDGNGSPDILVSGSSDKQVRILLNQGDGTFALGSSTPVGGGDLTVGHFYGNPSRLDLAVNIPGHTNQILVYQNTGAGKFEQGQVLESPETSVNGMTTADVNQDGQDDLLVAVAGVVQVFLANGDGTFQPPIDSIAHVPDNPDLAFSGGRITTADLRHNGKLDVVMDNINTEDISVLLGNNDGTFQPSTNYAISNGADTVVTGDFDADGNLDVIGGFGDLELLKGNGNGTLQGAIAYATTNTPDLFGSDNVSSVVSGDLNHDGIADFVTGTIGTSVDVLIGNGDGTLQPPVSYQVGSGPEHICLTDLNKDGNLDIVAADNEDSNPSRAISVLLGKSDGTFEPVQYVAGVVNTYTVTAADLNGDGKMDLAAICVNDNTVKVYFGNGDGTFLPPTSYSTDADPAAVAAADFNGDHKPDLLVTTSAGADGGFIDVMLNQGDGTFHAIPSVRLPDESPTNAIAYDLFQNGNNDIVFTEANHNRVVYYAGDGHGSFGPEGSVETLGAPLFVAPGDFDGDGIPDIAVSSFTANEITLLKGNGSTFSGTVVSRDAGGNPESMVATDINNDGTLDLVVGDTGGNCITILRNQSSATYFLLTAQSTPVTGRPCQFVVTAINAAGETIQNYNGTVHFTSNDPNATLPPDLTLTNGVGDVMATFNTVGAEYLRAADTSNSKSTGTSATFSVSTGQVVGPAAKFTIAMPEPLDAGINFSPIVKVYDAAGISVTDYTGTIHFSSTDPRAVLPADYTFLPSDHGSKTFTGAALITAGTWTFTVTDVTNAALTGGRGSVNVLADSAASLSVSDFPVQVTAGVTSSLTVSALDVYGNVSDMYQGIVHFSSTDPKAVLPADYQFLLSDLGIKTFSGISLQTAGTWSLTVTDVVSPTVTGSQANISVAPANAANLGVSSFPAQVTAGVASSLTVTMLDPYGNVATGYVGTVHFSSNDPKAVLPADYKFLPGDRGSKTFAGISLRTAGTWSLTVTDVASAALTGHQNNISVVPATAASLGVSSFPAQVTAGVTSSLAVTVVDAYGNVATGYVGTVHFSSNDPRAVLPADYKFLPSDRGSKTFAGISLKTAGTASLTVTDVASAMVTGSQTNISVVPASAASLVASNYPGQATAGVAPSITLTVLDAYGNVVTGYAGTVHFTSTDNQAVLPGDYKFAIGDHGVKTLQVALETAGPQTVTVSALGAPALVVTTNPISVSAGALANLLFLQQPTTGPSGVAMKPAVTVELLDAFGNVELSSTNQVTLALGDSSLTLGGSTSVDAVDGLATFSNLIVSGSGIGLTLQASASGVTAVPSAKFNSILLSNILPVEVAPQIYGPGPNTSAQDAFVKGIYRTVLGRDADPAGLSFWIGNLIGGSARTSIVTAFWNSPENRGREVDAYYQSYLGRAAEREGRSYWIGQLQAGTDETAIVLSFLLSAEELSAPDNVFVQRLYQGALGRDASTGEISFWGVRSLPRAWNPVFTAIVGVAGCGSAL